MVVAWEAIYAASRVAAWRGFTRSASPIFLPPLFPFVGRFG